MSMTYDTVTFRYRKLGQLCITGRADLIEQCFSNWVPRRGVSGSEGRKCVMAEDFIGGPKFLRTSINERSVLIMVF